MLLDQRFISFDFCVGVEAIRHSYLALATMCEVVDCVSDIGSVYEWASPGGNRARKGTFSHLKPFPLVRYEKYES